MTKRIVALGWAGALMVFFMAAQAQSVKMNPKTDNALLTRFQDAKLGLFVHWMACHTPTTGDSWSIGRGTPKTVADSITMSWNPEKFDARRIVDVAVQSGCRYMVVISKHHDGFCIWPSAYSDFDLDQDAVYGTRGGPYRQTDQLGSTYRGKKLVSSYS